MSGPGAIAALGVAASTVAVAVGGDSLRIHRTCISPSFPAHGVGVLPGVRVSTGLSRNLVSVARPTRISCQSFDKDSVDAASRVGRDEGNIVNKLPIALKTDFTVKEPTFRPEIRVLNLLLRIKTEPERMSTMEENSKYLYPESYFFEVLRKMTSDVEKQTNNRRRMQMLVQLRIIDRETKKFSRALKRARDGDDSVEDSDDDFP